MAAQDNPDFNHNLVTKLAPPIKAKITEYRLACEAYAFLGAAAVDDQEEIELALQTARYNLETVILTHLKRAAHHA